MRLTQKVVTSKEMVMVEKRAIEKGASAERFMLFAGEALASKMLEIDERAFFTRSVFALAGKGGNGGDALATAVSLKERGAMVTVVLLHPLRQCSPLLHKQYDRCMAAGVEVIPFSDLKMRGIPTHSIVIDGLTGTGFTGNAEGILAESIAWLNSTAAYVFSIDIPSGLPGDFVSSPPQQVVNACHTLYLEFPKIGLFSLQGYECAGTLHKVSFGLASEDIERAEPVAFLLDPALMPELLPAIKRTRNKYSTGAVAAFAGSSSMPGAGILCSSAALQSGAGIVKLYQRDAFSICMSEIIHELLPLTLDVRALSFLSRVQGAVIGPGLGRDARTKQIVASLFSSVNFPCVVDADAIWCLSEDSTLFPPKGSVLTPHSGELSLLLPHDIKEGTWEYMQACQQIASGYDCVLIAKGAPTVVYQKEGPCVIANIGDPGMATAGSGDVLAGVIAALIAQGLGAFDAACLGVFIHGRAGELAAEQKTSYSMIASDILAHLHLVFRWLKSQRIR